MLKQLSDIPLPKIFIYSVGQFDQKHVLYLLLHTFCDLILGISDNLILNQNWLSLLNYPFFMFDMSLS